MRFELRKSGGETCDGCGSHELLYSPASAAHFEADILSVFEADASKWKPLKRAAYRRVRAEIERACGELRARSRQDIS